MKRISAFFLFLVPSVITLSFSAEHNQDPLDSSDIKVSQSQKVSFVESKTPPLVLKKEKTEHVQTSVFSLTEKFKKDINKIDKKKDKTVKFVAHVIDKTENLFFHDLSKRAEKAVTFNKNKSSLAIEEDTSSMTPATKNQKSKPYQKEDDISRPTGKTTDSSYQKHKDQKHKDNEGYFSLLLSQDNSSSDNENENENFSLTHVATPAQKNDDASFYTPMHSTPHSEKNNTVIDETPKEKKRACFDCQLI